MTAYGPRNYNARSSTPTFATTTNLEEGIITDLENDTMDDTQEDTFMNNERDMDDDEEENVADGDTEKSEEDDHVDLYSILALDRRTATTEDVHRSYKVLSTSFHPDKMIRSLMTSSSLPASILQDSNQKHTFFFHAIKRAHETLSDPVLRLVYDEYGDDGVQIIKKVVEHQRDRKTRRQAEAQQNGRSDGEGKENSQQKQYTDDSDDEEDASTVEGEKEDSDHIYEQLAVLLEVQDVDEAKHVLGTFMKQHQYHQNLDEENHVHLSANIECPSVIDLATTVKSGQKYMNFVKKAITARGLPPDAEGRERMKEQLINEKNILEYQFNRLREGQKADIGFTLSSVPSNPSSAKPSSHERNLPPPKWSMAMGANTSYKYPSVAKWEKMVNQQKRNQKQDGTENVDEDDHEEQNPVSLVINAVHQPVANTQVTFTSNLSNDNSSHQFIVGTNRTFISQTAVRYNMTFLATSPLPTNLIFNIKTYRHLLNIGMGSAGFSVGGNGQVLQWSTKWEGMKRTKLPFSSLPPPSSSMFSTSSLSVISGVTQKVSAEAKIGLLQGSALELTYKAHLLDSPTTFRKSPSSSSTDIVSGRRQHKVPLWTRFLHFLDQELMTLPRKIDWSISFGQFVKTSAMFTHDLKALTGTHLGFGLEHNINLGLWTWIWELTYHGSSFRVPIPMVHLGSLNSNTRQVYYSAKWHEALICLLLQSLLAEVLQEPQKKKKMIPIHSNVEKQTKKAKGSKSKEEAERQLRMMERVADMKHFNESNHDDGLVILRAIYWVQERQLNDSVDTSNPSIVLKEWDVTKQLQFWIVDHQLVAPATPKRCWMGFYDLQDILPKDDDSMDSQGPFSLVGDLKKVIIDYFSSTSKVNDDGANNDSLLRRPRLTIRYKYRNEIYEVTFEENQPFVLPCNDDAELLGNADRIE